MEPKRPAALPNSATLSQLWEMLGVKLDEQIPDRLPSKQRAVGSNPAWDAIRCCQLSVSSCQFFILAAQRRSENDWNDSIADFRVGCGRRPHPNPLRLRRGSK